MVLLGLDDSAESIYELDSLDEVDAPAPLKTFRFAEMGSRCLARPRSRASSCRGHFSCTFEEMKGPSITVLTILSLGLILAACGGSSVSDPEGASGGSVSAGSTSQDEPEPGSGGKGDRASGGDRADATELGECDPLDDECPVGTYCQWLDDHTECIEVGSTERDAPCKDTGTCQRGSICLGATFSGQELCQQACPLDADPFLVCDIGRHTCFPATDDEGNELDFGVCRY